MKGVIYYYSNTGNTKIAMEYLVKGIASVSFTLVDMTGKEFIKPDSFDIVGFATYADFLSPPELFKQYVARLPRQRRKPAFVFNSYGNFNAGTLAHLHRCIHRKGFTVIGTHALHMPENIAVMICMGIANEHAPDERQMKRFDEFISGLEEKIRSGIDACPETVLPLRERLWPAFPRWLGKWQMGPKFVDDTACTRCGLCAAGCPYGAIIMDDLPRFRESKCAACWRCYNRCPTQAIYTKKYRNRGHYPQPLPAVREKLGMSAGTTP